MGPGPRDLGLETPPPKSLNVGPGTPIKFKSETPGLPTKFVGPPHFSLMNFLF